MEKNKSIRTIFSVRNSFGDNSSLVVSRGFFRLSRLPMSSKLQMHPGRVNSLEVKSFPSDPTLIGSPGNCRLRGLFSEVKRATKWDLNSYKLGHTKNFWTSAASGCSRGSGEIWGGFTGGCSGASVWVVVEPWCDIVGDMLDLGAINEPNVLCQFFGVCIGKYTFDTLQIVK